MFKKLFILFFVTHIATFISPVFSQKHGTGLNFDVPSYRGTPYKATLTASSYASMPTSASVEQYAPTPGDQGQYSTCVAFACAYHARTIMTAKLLGLTNKSEINKLIYSPTWIYEQIKDSKDLNCKNGTSPIDALELMKNKGCSSISKQPYQCGSKIADDAKIEASDYKLDDFQILFLPDVEDVDVRVRSTKKALAEGMPVVLCFIVAESFYKAGVLWEPLATDDGPTGQHGRHAMCVVGYDDNKYGGAFRVLNSWGIKWGDGGFVWIKYADYAKYAMGALQPFPSKISVKPLPVPEPDPTITPQPKPTPVVSNILSGEVEFRKNTGEMMEANKISTRNLVIEDEKQIKPYGEDLVAYRMNNNYASGTKFRFFINTNSEAYVYAFATDLTGIVNKILPFQDGMSPHIGANSQIAFPSETKIVKMDENKGTDYMLILFSSEKLDANAMLEKMNAVKGGLSSKIAAALGNKLLLPSKVQYKTNSIGFDASGNSEGKVVPLMVEITHI